MILFLIFSSGLKYCFGRTNFKIDWKVLHLKMQRWPQSIFSYWPQHKNKRLQCRVKELQSYHHSKKSQNAWKSPEKTLSRAWHHSITCWVWAHSDWLMHSDAPYELQKHGGKWRYSALSISRIRSKEDKISDFLSVDTRWASPLKWMHLNWMGAILGSCI